MFRKVFALTFVSILLAKLLARQRRTGQARVSDKLDRLAIQRFEDEGGATDPPARLPDRQA